MIEFEFKEHSNDYICRDNQSDAGMIELVGGSIYYFYTEEDNFLNAQDLRAIADKLDELNEEIV